jgi:long-subunit acyl-CoA synthetase (AMP-forming)
MGMPISEGWGMSESSSLSCVNYPFSADNLGTIGFALDCVEMKLSQDGEILLRGDAVFSQYYLDSASTEISFVDGWFRTGDCAEINNDGAYNIIGRIKDKFKTSKGKYVAPVPIESLLSTNPHIEQVCVVGSGLKQPIALVVLNATTELKKVEIEHSLQQTLFVVNEKLESHQKLAHIIFCKEVWSIENELLTPTMKIKRNIIENKYEELVTKELNDEVLWEENI